MAQLGLAAGLRNHVSDGIVEGRLSTTLHDQCEKLDSMMEGSCWRYRERRVEVCVYNMGLAGEGCEAPNLETPSTIKS